MMKKLNFNIKANIDWDHRCDNCDWPMVDFLMTKSNDDNEKSNKGPRCVNEICRA